MPNSENIDYLLQHLTSLLARNSDQILQEQLGVGYAQYKILRMVGSELPLKQIYIAKSLGQTEASISRQIKKLMKKGYITKTIDPMNKRARLIKITPKGEEISRVSSDVLGKYHNSMLSNFTEKQKTSLYSLLEEFHSYICNSAHTTGPDYLNFISES